VTAEDLQCCIEFTSKVRNSEIRPEAYRIRALAIRKIKGRDGESMDQKFCGMV
jgi:hypothetical protein